MYKCCTETMHDHGTESHVLFRVTVSNASGMCFKICVEPNSVPIVSVCLARHRLKQIKLSFNAHPGCEAALRSVFSHITCYIDQ